MPASSDKRNYLVVLVSLAVYLGSLFLPVFEFQSHSPVQGFEVLLLGWLGLLALNPAWLANPAFFVSLVLLLIRKYRSASIFSFCAVLLGLASFFAKDWYFDESSGTPITGLGTAFYVWMASLGLLLLGSLWLSIRRAGSGTIATAA